MPRRGLEPPRLAAQVPETCASTNSATWAVTSARYSAPRGVSTGARRFRGRLAILLVHGPFGPVGGLCKTACARKVARCAASHGSTAGCIRNGGLAWGAVTFAPAEWGAVGTMRALRLSSVRHGRMARPLQAMGFARGVSVRCRGRTLRVATGGFRWEDRRGPGLGPRMALEAKARSERGRSRHGPLTSAAGLRRLWVCPGKGRISTGLPGTPPRVVISGVIPPRDCPRTRRWVALPGPVLGGGAWRDRHGSRRRCQSL